MELLELGGSRVAIHIRARNWSGRELYTLTRRLVDASRTSGSTVLVNDRLDVALAAGAPGVQLGTNAMPVPSAREIAPAMLIGASVHSVGEARAACAGGANFLLAGTLWPTESHPGLPGAGTSWLPDLHPLGVPVIGIGGVNATRARELRALGVHGAAVVRAVWSAPAPHDALGALLEALYPEGNADE